MRSIPISRLLAVASCLLFTVSVLTSADSVLFAPLGDGYGSTTTFQVVLGDLDGDGDLDAVFANQGTAGSRVLLNDGDGVFDYTTSKLSTQAHGAALGDLDGDGDLDLLMTCSHYNNRPKPSVIYVNDGTGAFADSGQDLGDEHLSGNYVQLIDFEGDGDLDAYIAYLEVPAFVFTGRLYLNDGNGVFTESGLELPHWTTFVDLDEDGDADAFVQEDQGAYTVQLQYVAGRLTTTWAEKVSGITPNKSDAVFLDVDGDGDLDIIDTNGSWDKPGVTRYLQNLGVGRFEISMMDLPNLSTSWLLLEDFDGDGFPDLFFSSVNGADQLWLGLRDDAGQLSFADSDLRLDGNDSRGAAAGDLDGDGDLDLFIPVYGIRGGPNIVWENVIGE